MYLLNVFNELVGKVLHLPNEVGRMIVAVSQMKKLRFTEVEYIVQTVTESGGVGF